MITAKEYAILKALGKAKRWDEIEDALVKAYDMVCPEQIIALKREQKKLLDEVRNGKH